MIVSALTAYVQNSFGKHMRAAAACANRALVGALGVGLPYGPYHARSGELP